jgi:hypothetical protein
MKTMIKNRWSMLLLAATMLSPAVGGYSVEYKIQKMEKQLEDSGRHAMSPMVLNSRTFNTYTEAPRNYSIFVTMTAVAPQFNCVPCK